MQQHDDLDALFDDAMAGSRPADTNANRGGQDARRTAKRKALLEAGVHPVTRLTLHPQAAPVDNRAAQGARCGDCTHCLTRGHHNKTYVKCDAVELTHGPGSDTRRWYPACTLHEPRPREEG